MELELPRRVYTSVSTTGEFRLNGQHFCYTVEDHFPTPYVKTPGKTAIPEGVYLIDMNTISPRYGRIMPRVYNVVTASGEKVVRSPDGRVEFRGILIHTGNDADDSEGCIIVGRKLGVNRVDESRLAYEALLPHLTLARDNGEPIYCVVKRAA